MRLTRSRRIYLTVTALLLAPAVAACGGGSGGTAASSSNNTAGVTASGGSYKVVVLADLSGEDAPNCKPGVAGVQAAVATINAAGGISGKKLQISVIDTQTSVDVARTSAQQAISESPFGVIMFVTGAEGVAVTPLMHSVADAWRYMLTMTAGVGLVMILRWTSGRCR